LRHEPSVVRPEADAMPTELATVRAEPVKGRVTGISELRARQSYGEPVDGPYGFMPVTSLPDGLGRSGVITTPHGTIKTPAFVAVGTKATVKAVLPESMAALGAQALLANAYHLYLQPGPDVIEAAGGLGRFMNWSGPTFTDSGGFQVMSLGAGFKKILAMNIDGMEDDDVIAAGKTRLAHVDEDGVTFTSHLDGSQHRFTPEHSMRIQHQMGADIIFAFDECTTLMNTRDYQEKSVARTQRWAARCLAEHLRLTKQRGRAYQALFAVVQGAQSCVLDQRWVRFRWLRHWRGARKGQPWSNSPLGERRAALRQAPAPARHLRAE
jgi:queuine tRNA-ribosyltransferase